MRITLLSSDAYTVGLVKYRDPYPFGVDPSWRGSRTELPYLNSLKMKMSILLGISQMNLGLILSFFNARFFGSSLDIRFVLLSIFYLHRLLNRFLFSKTTRMAYAFFAVPSGISLYLR